MGLGWGGCWRWGWGAGAGGWCGWAGVWAGGLGAGLWGWGWDFAIGTCCFEFCDLGGFESDGLEGSVGAGLAGLGWEGSGAGAGVLRLEPHFLNWVLRLETESNLVFVTGTCFWVGLGWKLTV